MTMTLEQFQTLQKGTTTFCLLGKVTATADKGGNVIRFARHSENIGFENEFYPALPVEVSEFQTTAGTEINNATFQTVLADSFDRLRIKGGKWAGANVQITIVDYTNLAAGYIQRQHGRFGQAKIIGLEAEIEFRGLTQLLSQEIGDKTSRLCRYQLGDSRCKVNVANFTSSGTVMAVTGSQKFSISVSKPDGYFYRGRISFTSGANSQLSMETSGNTGTLLTLFQPMLKEVAVGDAFFLTAGDDKSLRTCYSKFANAVNFGAEDGIPEREKLFKFPNG